MQQLRLETDSRSPSAKHRILEFYVEHGFKLPDTPAAENIAVCSWRGLDF